MDESSVHSGHSFFCRQGRKDDRVEAAKYFKLAADQNFADGQLSFGFMKATVFP
jgi:TPR repeat protein